MTARRTSPPPEMPPEAFREAARRVAAWVADYRERVADLPVIARTAPGEVAGRLPDAAPEEPETLDAVLEDLDGTILPGITHWNHPGFLAYFSSSSSAAGVLAEFVIAALGVNAMLWRTSPAATELEERTVGWLRRAVGLPAEFRGVIQDTASSSSFTSLLAAREALGLGVRAEGLAGRPDLPRLSLYVSEQAHSSLEKAAIAAGLGRRSVRKVPTDARYRMDPGALAGRIREDRDAGHRPTMVCATVGTTSTASVDPVEEIAAVCAGERVWLHVDAAYAGPAAVLPELRDRFRGWERADSVVLNPHKWMGTPMDLSVLLFRRPEPFRASLALTPEYLRTGVEGVTDLMDYGLPLGRRFRALKLWFLFRLHGLEGIRRMLRRHIRLAREFAERVEADPRFALAAPPSFSTVCFRPVLPPNEGGETAGGKAADGATAGVGAADEAGHRILEAVNRGGSVFLSHTELEGRFTLRLSVGSVHTRDEDVRRAWSVLTEAYERARDARGPGTAGAGRNDPGAGRYSTGPGTGPGPHDESRSGQAPHTTGDDGR